MSALTGDKWVGKSKRHVPYIIKCPVYLDDTQCDPKECDPNFQYGNQFPLYTQSRYGA